MAWALVTTGDWAVMDGRSVHLFDTQAQAEAAYTDIVREVADWTGDFPGAKVWGFRRCERFVWDDFMGSGTIDIEEV